MTDIGVGPGWFPDPDGSGGQRYFDGTVWTEHRVPPPPPPPPPPYPGYGGWAIAPWKGAQLGRPPYGPGALADPGRRFAARLLDGLVLLPVFVVIAVFAVVQVAPHVGPIFPKLNARSDSPQPTPGLIWIYLTLFGCLLATGVVTVLYEAVATTRYGRTLGKRWLHIRPVRTNGTALGWGRSFGRSGVYWASGLLSWVGLLDPLWCLWDVNRQCLHDKAADTIVINDVQAPTGRYPPPPQA